MKQSSQSSWWRYLGALIAGALYPLAFAPLNWWFLALISIAAFWLLLKQQASRCAAKIGFCYGFGLFGVGISWVYVSINTFGNASPPLAVFLTLLFIAILSLLFAFLAWAHRRFGAKFSLSGQLIAFSLLWLALDLFQSYSFISFPWLFVGYSQTGQAFAGIGSLLGVHGLTLYLVPLAILLAEALANRRINSAAMLGFIVYAVIGLGLSWWGISGKIEQKGALTVALVQPNTDQHQKWNPEYFAPIVNGLLQQTENYWGADLVVWPEAAIPAMDSQVDFLLDDLSTKAQESGSTFITGIPLRPDPEASQIYYAGIKMLGQQQVDYRKQQLVPFGEYVPMQSLFRGLIDFFDLPMSSFTPGDAKQSGFETDKAYLIPAICYEIAFSNLIQRLSSKSETAGGKAKPKAILTISNDTWFGTSWGPLQHFQMAQMRAIENGLPVIRGTNNGITALINHYGQVIDQEPRFVTTELAGLMPLTQRYTIFGQFGYWPLAVICLILVLTLGLNSFLRSRPR
ncbi:apolipoprotein N-acyltransferase [Kangiella sp. TOML190]|uniref:apolipoprotein N-acyltransferase n=1 Tax=Kangiella sp. TOML190 TaxID=2931351 RepID=UPI00203E9765|nr:apolipoprotein N-acyltransferase [Kangiella sp. TOML190]